MKWQREMVKQRKKTVWRRRIAALLALSVLAASLQLSVFAESATDEGSLSPALRALMEQLLEDGTLSQTDGEPLEEGTVGGAVYGEGKRDLAAALTAKGGTEKISISVNGAAATGDSRASSISGDGRYVAFVSTSATIVEGKTNGFQDVFVRDRTTGMTQLISLGSDGDQANGDSYAPMISMDGTYVLFSSKATNLVPGDTNSQEDLFLYDASTGKVQRIAERVPGSEYAGHGSPYQVSTDGRFAAYVGNNGPESANNNILLKDLRTGAVKLVAARTFLYDQTRARVSMSADARFLVFESFQRELTLDDYGLNYGKYRDIFLYDTVLDELKRISRSPAEGSANENSQYPVISANGQFVAYQSLADNLGPADTNGKLDIYVYDRVSGTTELGSVRSDGSQAQSDAFHASLSGDGRYLSFHTSGAFGEDDTGDVPDVYVRDRWTGTTKRVSNAHLGGNANGESVRATFAADGLSIAFESNATDLLATADVDAFSDIYVVPLEGAGGSAPEWPVETVPSAAPGGAYVALSWPEVPGAAYYKILQDGKLAGITKEPRYAASGLLPGTAYTYRVAAGSADFRWSGWSGEAAVRTLTAPETTPPGSGIVTATVQPGLIEAEWQLPNDPDVVGARLIWRMPGQSERQSAMYPKHVNRAKIPNVMNGEDYEVQIAVYDGDGNRSLSGWQPISIPPGPAIVRIDTRAEDGRAAPGEAVIEDMSEDGRYTVFISSAPDLALSDTNGKRDLFLYDRFSGKVQLISRTASGAAGDGESRDASMSGDGRYIVFTSDASNLTADVDSNGQYDVFLYDRDMNGNGIFDEEGDVSLTRISTSWDGKQADSYSYGPDISGDGTKVVFFTRARNLVQEPPESTTYNVSYDMETGALAPILLPDGKPLSAQNLVLNRDGSVAVFTTPEDLLPEDSNGDDDIYLYDAGGMTLELVTARGALGRAWPQRPAVDDSGRYVAFTVSRNTPPYSQVYVYDREKTGDAKYELISVVPQDREASMHSSDPDISRDGRYVSFHSNEPGLMEGDGQGQSIFIRDRTEQVTKLASRTYNPAVVPNDYASKARISGDGSWIAYNSNADNLVRGMERYRPGLYLGKVLEKETQAVWPAGSSLTVKASGADFVTLTWTPATGAKAYRILGAGAPVDGEEGVIEKTITGLMPGTDYLFKVEALDEAGVWTTNGPSVAFSTPAATDLAELAVTQQGSKAILVWGERPGSPGGIHGFRVVRRTANEPAEVLATIEDPAVRTYTDEAAESGKAYIYAVLALDAGGLATPYSVERSITLSAFVIDSFSHTLPLYFRKYAGVGDLVRLVMKVKEADAARAELTFELPDGGRTTVKAVLTAQTASDTFIGQAAIPAHAVRLLQIRGFAERGGESAEASSLQGPIQIGGSVRVALKGAAALPHDATLTIGSAGQRAYQTATIGEARQFSFVGLPAGGDYSLRLLSTGGVDMLEEGGMAPITLSWGDAIEVEAEPMLPASLSIVAIDSQDVGLKDIHVLVSDENGRPLASGITQESGQLDLGILKGMVGKTAVIRAEPQDGYDEPAEIPVLLDPGMNRQEIMLSRTMDAVLEGKVYQPNGTPLEGAVVTVVQGGAKYTASTDAEGTYSLNVPSLGSSVQAVADGVFPSVPQWIRAVPGRQTVDIQIDTALPAVVKVNLYTQSGEGAWVGPYALDWTERIHFRVRADKPIWAEPNNDTMLLVADPGEKVSICADGTEGGYSLSCADTVIDDNRRGTVELRLRDTAATVVGRLSNLLEGVSQYDYSLFEVTDEGRRRAERSGSFYSAEFSLKLKGGLHYELEVRSPDGNQSVVQFFETQAGSRTDLGELPLGTAGILAGKPGNVVWIGSGKPTAGGMAQVRSTYSNSSAHPLMEVAAVLDVPADTELISGTVILNGTAVEPDLQNGRYTVPLGTIGAGKGGSLQYKLRIAANPAAGRIMFEPAIRYKLDGIAREEKIGRAEADLTPVTLKAPSRTGQRDLTVTGSAPPGSRVTLYEGDIVLGVTEASPAGLWDVTTHIPGEGATALWRLRANAESETGRWSSSVVSVRYDKGLPEPVSFTMRQADGRLITLDPRAGESKFPYVFVPGKPFTLTVAFTDPQLVKDTTFLFGDQRIPASLQNGVYQAVIPAQTKGAPIGFDYTEKEPMASIDAPPPPPEELKRRLPPSFRDATTDYLYISPRQNNGTKQSASYKGTLPNPNGDAQMDINATLEEMKYTPSQDELDQAERTGIPLYGFRHSLSFRDGVLRAELTGYLPADRFSHGLDVEKAITELVAAAELNVVRIPSSGKTPKGSVSVQSVPNAIQAVKVTVDLAMRSKAGENTWKTIDAAFSLHGGLGVNDTLVDLEKLMDKIALSCRPELVPIYLEGIMLIRNKIIMAELMKAGMMVAGTVFGPATFGMGTVGMFLATNMMGKVLDATVASSMAKLDASVDETCETKNKPKKPKKRLADPEWIYDPSGYAYEVTEVNRIEGVKTTVLRWDEGAQRWNIWNAGPYGQMNPIYTDPQGRYAWDVPEGKWKVLYEKEGYLPAESEELVVLPPHFDVNIPMISTLPARPIKTSVAPGGASIELLFDRHVRSEAADDGLLVVVSEESGEEVAGEWQALEPIAINGAQASARLRFTPDDPLTVGAVYRVTAEAALQSYAGVPTGERYEAEVTVTAADTTPPLPVEGLQVEVDAKRALLNWRLPRDPELVKVELRYKEQAASGEAGEVEIPADQPFALVEGLSESTNYVFQILAYDAAGNYSTAEVKASTGSPGSIGPDVTPPAAIREPSAKAAATEIELTWSDPADPDLAIVNLQWTKTGQPFEGEPVDVRKGVGRFAITGLTPATEYEIRHWTVDESGNASTAESLFVTTTAGGGGPTGPTDPTDPPDPPGPTDPPSPTSPTGPVGEPDTGSAELGEEAVSFSLFDGKLRFSLLAGSRGTARKLTALRIADPVKPSDKRLRLLSSAYEWKLDNGKTLAKPGRLTLAYDKVAFGLGDPRKLGVYRLDAASGVWRYAGGVVDARGGAVELETALPGVYAVLVAAYGFSDLDDHWGRADIEALAARGIVTGDPGGTFRPNGSVTRAEFVKLMASLIDAEPIEGAKPFDDVPADAWYAEAIAEASAAGVVVGDGGKFRPNDPVSREEMAVMLYRASVPDAAGDPSTSSLDGYLDGGEVSAWAREAVAYEVRSGTLQGSGGLLKPTATATRAEAAAVIARKLDALGLLVKH
ncbi:component of the Tol biopolymer transport system [Paenibacillus sp. UNCCL117]|uniref:S-layer homology domain-containing protein n=1 Tax=unclassified Paenibacillus TaxID=185978 RepID=UPI00088EA70C|nr:MULTISPECIES: S-layer homology domain-containing protein [unclassified Paenibacillus]SDC26854.1 component of the Tol biopolymer transport system [Paenibacillus sp. cl123]SFW20201.1 component of the Tol biopolymer transport system [Paenibacillus sp. UNCCL117]